MPISTITTLPSAYRTITIQWLDLSFFSVQEYHPYQYDISRLPECAYANKHYYNITFCLQEDYFLLTCLFCVCAGVSSLPVRHQSDDGVRLRQQALLQHNLLPKGRLLFSGLTCLFFLCRSIIPTSMTLVSCQSAPTPTNTTTTLPSAYRTTTFYWHVFFVYMQESRPYQYDISRIMECAYANKHYYNITFCLQDDYFPLTWLVFFDCLGVSSLSVWHQSAARVRLCQQALLQHNLLPTGWLLSGVSL
jgi:hypothetical protein